MSQTPKLTYPELLARATAKTARLERSLKDLRQQDYELTCMRNQLDIRNLDAFHAQRKELFTQAFYVEADVRRSRRREELLRRKIAEGQLMDQMVAA